MSTAASVEACVALVDLGSTFTKVRAVTESGRLAAAVQHRTTVDTDVHDGLNAALAEIATEHPELTIDRVLACSSAGGGLRMGVVGLVDELTAEAARQAALGAGARVLSVVSGGLADGEAARALIDGKPDIVLLVGGTDGGDRASLIASADALAEAGLDKPVVIAGNAEAQSEAAATLRRAGVHVVQAPNVMPEINSLVTEPTRAVVRELFISHVIGGKLAGFGPDLEELVKMATPDAALAGVEALAGVLEASGTGLIAVDIGGATTDVHSWISPVEAPGYKRSLLPQLAAARTVEGDLGMRWNAPGIVEAGLREDLLSVEEARELMPAAEHRAAEPGFLPDGPSEVVTDRTLARIAIAVALRRHAGVRRIALTAEGGVLRRCGRDLSDVNVVLATGGVLRSLRLDDMRRSLELARSGRESRLLPADARVGIDRRGCLAAAGLLAAEEPERAVRLLRSESSAYFSISEKERTEDVIATG